MASPARFRAVIFDFDGVIADSIPLHFESFRRLFADEGVEFTMADYRRAANGAPRDVVIRGVLGEVAPEPLRDLMARKERYVFELLARRVLRPFPGALELARAFRARGLKTAIASSSRTARRFLDALKPFDPGLGPPAALFDAVVEGDGVRAPKPDPEIFLLAARAVGVEPAACLAIEDAVNGVRAARAAGMRVIAVATTEPPEALGEAHAVYRSFGEIDIEMFLAPWTA